MLALSCIQFYWMEVDTNEIHPLMHTSEIAFIVRRTRLMREYEAAICRRWREGRKGGGAMPSSFLPSLYLLGCDMPKFMEVLRRSLARLPVAKEALLRPLFRTLDGGHASSVNTHIWMNLSSVPSKLMNCLVLFNSSLRSYSLQRISGRDAGERIKDLPS